MKYGARLKSTRIVLLPAFASSGKSFSTGLLVHGRSSGFFRSPFDEQCVVVSAGPGFHRYCSQSNDSLRAILHSGMSPRNGGNTGKLLLVGNWSSTGSPHTTRFTTPGSS